MTDNPQNDDRAAALKILSRTMVHSLNNMLFLIGAYKDLIKQDQQDPELLGNVKQIEAALEQSQRIMRDWRVDADKIVPDTEEDI